MAFNGETWDMIRWTLRPWNYHCSKISENFFEEIIKFYKWEWLKKIIWRMDSGFSTPKIYELCEREAVEYYVKLKWNNVLQTNVEWKWERWISLFEEFEYKAQSWNKARRVVACIDWKATKKDFWDQLELFPVYSFIVTNNTDLSKEEVFSMYNGRATIENSIEEAKNGFNIDHLSHKEFKANSALFQIHLLAIQIMQLFRKFWLAYDEVIAEGWEKKEQREKKFVESKKKTKKFKKKKVGRKKIKLPSISTIREKIIWIPAKIVSSWRKIFYKCASGFAYKELFLKCLIIYKDYLF